MSIIEDLRTIPSGGGIMLWRFYNVREADTVENRHELIDVMHRDAAMFADRPG